MGGIPTRVGDRYGSKASISCDVVQGARMAAASRLIVGYCVCFVCDRYGSEASISCGVVQGAGMAAAGMKYLAIRHSHVI
jgi:adenine deaminase